MGLAGLRQSLVTSTTFRKTEIRGGGGPFSTDCRKRGSHAQGVYPTQDSLRMGTARGRSRDKIFGS